MRAALLLALLAGPALAETTWLLAPAQRAALSDRYAAVLFDGLAPVEEVLASRRWHAEFGGWGCTYAVVALPPDAPPDPPSRGDEPLGWEFAFGGDWRPTPMPPLGDTTRDAVAACEGEWPAGLGDRLRAALAAPGAHYWTDGVGEQVHLWAPAAGLAAQVRYGD